MENQKHDRPESRPEVNRLFGFELLDSNEKSIGKIDNIWMDDTGQPAFFGIHTGWLSGKVHVVPAHQAEVSYRRQCVRVPHSEDKIKDAPSFDTSSDLTAEQEREVYDYYNLRREQQTEARGPGLGGTTEMAQPQQVAETEPMAAREPEPLTEEPQRTGQQEEEQTIQLNEEHLEIERREVNTGGVRLRKVIRTETVNEPIELKHEEIEVERVPAEGAQGVSQSNFEEEEIFIPLRREEAVAHKETHPTEQVRVTKKSAAEQKEISDTVRKEDVEIERDDERRYGT